MAEGTSNTRDDEARQPWLRRHLRKILLIGLPAVTLLIGLEVYLSGGRYISTDNAYVGTTKVLVTPDVSGKISRVAVAEGQRVAAGDVLFELDAEPFRLALRQAEARLAGVTIEFANLRSNDAALARMAALAQQTADLKQRDVQRKTELMTNRSGSQADVDVATNALVAANNQLEQLRQQQATVRNQLLGDPDLPQERYPAWQQAKAALDQARRDLDHAVLRAPIAGIATQVDNIQLGRFVAVGTPILSVMDDARPWVDANPKETDVTFLRVGQAVTLRVDAFPGHVYRGEVVAISPGTGAQFAILPPQNASGNWIKVVQRVPVRISVADDGALAQLRAGMSVLADIDTGRRRSLATLFGGTVMARTDTPATRP